MQKIVIVTGSAGNLGQAVVNKFIAENHLVIGTVTTADPPPSDLLKGQFEAVVVDLLKEDDVTSFVSAIIEKYKRIDTVVLTVGGFAVGKIGDTSTADIAKQYRLNFETAYNITRPVFVQMQRQGYGRIFLIGSKPGLDAMHGKGMVAYGLAKSLIFRLAELMNDEAKGSNIVTSVVVPGTIDTPQNRSAIPDAKPENWVTPEAIADVIHFYSTPKAAVIREAIIKVYNNS